MNSNPTIEKPGAQSSADEKRTFLFLRITLPIVPEFTPDYNFIGLLLLRALLEARLQLAGIPVELIGCTGTLNQSICLMKVNASPGPALAAIKATLEVSGLLAAAQFGWCDTGEEIIRLVHPVNGHAILFPHEELTAGASQYDQVLAKLETILQRQSTEPSDNCNPS